MLTPRPYISYSQMVKFEMSPERFVEEYLYHGQQHVSKNMAYGTKFAEGLEHGEASGDPLLDLMMARMPKFELMDLPLMADLKNGKETIHLLAKPDTAKSDYTAFKEYKTSVQKWTQKRADDSGQITFYATTIWLAKGIRPEDQDIELVNAQVQYLEGGMLAPTGDIWRFPTKRTLVDAARMTGRIRKAWAGIKELCEQELL